MLIKNKYIVSKKEKQSSMQLACCNNTTLRSKNHKPTVQTTLLHSKNHTATLTISTNLKFSNYKLPLTNSTSGHHTAPR